MEANKYLYQLSLEQFEDVWGCSEPTVKRRRSWAQENYPNWRKVFLYGGRIDLKEYQKFNSYYSSCKYEERQDPHLKVMEDM